MASTYTDLGLELMASGENAGNWGNKTNANLSLIEQLTGGYLSQAVTNSGTPTALTIADGALTGTAQQRVIELTGSISGSRVVTFPLLTENFYIIKNSTSGSQTVQIKAVSGSGATVTFATDDKGYKLIYLDGVATNTGVFEATVGATGDVTLTGTQTLTNKTLTNPILSPTTTTAGKVEFLEGTDNGTNKLTLIGPAATADVTLNLPAANDTLVGKATTDTLTNKTLTSPAIGTKISDTNGNELINLTATGSAVNEITIANAGTGVTGPVISASGETNVGINVDPKGTGIFKSGGNAVKIAGLETMWVPASAMYGPTTNPADAAQVETTAARPDLKVFDFDASTVQYTQFSVAFPKSWNEGTVTYQVYWSPSTTNTGNCIFAMQGVSCGDGDTIDVAYGTQQNITDAGIGTVEDQQVSPISSALTIAGSPAESQQTYFQFFREASSGADTFTGESRVLGVKIFFTTDAANDA